jgi:hypothetical protein
MIDEHFSNNIMLEPSLILAKNKIDQTFERVRVLKKNCPDLNFYYPDSMIRLLEDDNSKNAQLSEYFLFNADKARINVVLAHLKENSDILTGYKSNHQHVNDKYSEIKTNMREDLYYLEKPLRENVTEILTEEWVFLQEQSWIVSRIKKPFNRFIEAGGVCLQFSGKATDKLVNRSLRRSNDHVILTVDRLRAVGKWIAVGGGAAAGVWAPPAISLPVSLVAGYFALFDPPSAEKNE